MTQNILVTGATGTVGRQLGPRYPDGSPMSPEPRRILSTTRQLITRAIF
jgi:nucleoside-diphosphate-sugar epimerase